MNRYLMAPSGGLATASHLHPQPLGAQFFPNWASRPARGSSPTTRRRARIADSRCRNENAPEPKTAPTASNTNAPSTTPDTPPTHHPSRCDGEPVGEAGRVVWGRILTRYGGRPGLRRTGVGEAGADRSRTPLAVCCVRTALSARSPQELRNWPTLPNAAVQHRRSSGAIFKPPRTSPIFAVRFCSNGPSRT